MSEIDGFNGNMLRFLAEACAALDDAVVANDERKSLLYLGRVEVKMESEVVGYLVDYDGIGYSYESAATEQRERAAPQQPMSEESGER